MKKTILLLILLCCAIQAVSQNWEEVQKLVASDRATYDYFSESVAIDGDYAIVGAYREDNDSILGNPEDGAAYIFERDMSGDWNEIQKIIASDRSPFANFGNFVSISGNYAVVGAPGESKDEVGDNPMNLAGAAYIFERDAEGNWQEVQKIVASDRDPADLFAFVAISGDFIVVGTPGEDEDADGLNTIFNSGAAYIFERAVNGDWHEVQKLVASDRSEDDFFGFSASISGNTIIVAAFGEDEDAAGENPLDRAGSAYIFERAVNGDWHEVQKIVASDRGVEDNFGNSLSIHDQYVIVGAKEEQHDTSGGDSLYNAGSAYIFEKDEFGIWHEVQKLVAPERAVHDRFGESVCLHGDIVIVGMPFEDKDAMSEDSLIRAGAAYLFQKSEDGIWSVVQKITASDRDTDDRFGSTVAISDQYVLVGAKDKHGTDSSGNEIEEAGSAYMFEILPKVGIVENTIDIPLTIYPNPSYGAVTIDLGQTYNEIKIILHNMMGQATFFKHYKSVSKVDIEIDGPPGMYLIEIHSTKGYLTTIKHLKM